MVVIFSFTNLATGLISRKLNSTMSSYRWIIDPPLEITVPSKRTPWPDAPPELPSNKKLTINQEQTIKRSPKTRSPRSKRRSKRKHEAKLVETQVSTRHSEQN
jgi:hypothetical protein